MKKIILSTIVGLSAMLLLNGCLLLGTGDRHETHPPTTGQQLVDLKKARDAGAISDGEFEAQKQKLLEHK